MLYNYDTLFVIENIIILLLWY